MYVTKKEYGTMGLKWRPLYSCPTFRNDGKDETRIEAAKERRIRKERFRYKQGGS